LPDHAPITGVYGAPSPGLAAAVAEAVQLSPLVPGAASLEQAAPDSFTSILMLAPPGAVERRATIALALRALRPDGSLVVLAPKDKGGSRLAGELRAFGCAVAEDARRHHRICRTGRPVTPIGLQAAIDAGAPQLHDALGAWTQPGVFSWDRLDPGSALLIEHLPPLAGRGADLGCGVGTLARAVLRSPQVQRLSLVDIDRRAVDAARRNLDDPRADLWWADALGPAVPLDALDFVVMNPPFHSGGDEDRALGGRFIARAHQALRRGGTLWLVANRHLPYEAALRSLFSTVHRRAEHGGYKVYEAQR
jgi:16S rRNA (guanine1207-N2)-methyltransferase